MKIIFLGTPEFSIPSLKAIYESKHELIAIVSQPDRATIRGNKVFSPVKEFAIKNNIPIFQFDKISRDGVEIIKNLEPDLMVTASFGQILSQQIIDIPKYGIINVHASILPDYRGASPIQTAIINGDIETGVTIMQTEAGLDTGNILSVVKTEIKENETAGELSVRLAELGSKLLIEIIGQIDSGEVVSLPQPHIDAQVTKRINKEEGRIVWEQSAKQIRNKIHGFNPSPVAFTFLGDNMIKLYRAKIADEDIEFDADKEVAGTIINPSSAKNGVFVKCGSGVLEIVELQFPNQKVISGKDAINGRKLKVGDVFSYGTEIEKKSPTILK